jgi:predicted TIM-barrel fold metal-dependent hydrolase
VAQFPGRFLGQALVNPHDGMKAVREPERMVKELGLQGFYASPFCYGLPPNQKKLYPLCAKAVELHIPVFVYVTIIGTISPLILQFNGTHQTLIRSRKRGEQCPLG